MTDGIGGTDGCGMIKQPEPPKEQVVLTDDQRKMFEPLICVMNTLEDRSGKVIGFGMRDEHIIEQIVQRLYRADGTPRTAEEILTICMDHVPTWMRRLQT